LFQSIFHIPSVVVQVGSFVYLPISYNIKRLILAIVGVALGGIGFTKSGTPGSTGPKVHKDHRVLRIIKDISCFILSKTIIGVFISIEFWDDWFFALIIKETTILDTSVSIFYFMIH
jgi:hypothetical protein